MQAHGCGNAVAGGLNLSDGYRLAYATKAVAPSTVWNNAHVLAQHNDVAARVKEIMDAVAAQKVWSKEQLLVELGRNLDNGRRNHKWSAANRALWQIGRIEALT